MRAPSRPVRNAALACALALALAPGRGGAEVYVWTDAQGNVQMTEDLSQVPPEQRVRAIQAGAEIARSGPAKSDAASAETRRAPTRKKSAKPSAGKKSASRRHVLRVERAGSEMRVEAEVNGVVIPFILDTGASICSLPRWAVDEMGIEIDADTPTIAVTGISGQAQQVPELQIGSVTVGDAEVSDLPMAVLDTMSEGLLGMPFFNHFRVSTDPAEGLLILEEIDLDATDQMVGGLNEVAWRKRFTARRQRLEAARRKLERVPDEYVTTRERLEKEVEHYERQLDALDLEATRAGVPQGWRE